jgi:hypothetical protein
MKSWRAWIPFVLVVLPAVINAGQQPVAPSSVQTRAENESFLSTAAVVTAAPRWLDDFAMNEMDRRRRGIDPPNPETWAAQMHAIRLFDELISNTYRDTSPPLYLNSVWDNLLITNDWAIWLTDHTGAFRIRRQLQDAESLTRSPRAVLGKLRELTRDVLQPVLGKYLSAAQLDALDVRRALLVKHFDNQIARNGESAVLYNLPLRR